MQLPFGVTPAEGMFQRKIDEMFKRYQICLALPMIFLSQGLMTRS